MKTLKRIAWLLPALLLSGCFGTISPKATKAKQASFSAVADPVGNYQTSGVWGWRTNHNLIIDYIGRDTYNSLIARGWGITLTPPITNLDTGITAYTNDYVEPLIGVDGKWTPPVKNPGRIFDMDSYASDAWPIMTTLSRAPKAVPPHPP